MSQIAILPADKGNVTILTKKDGYHAKIKGLLDSGTYKVLKGDPTLTHENRIGRKLRELVKQGEMSESLYQTLRTSDSQPSRIYGLPKLHKPEVPLRPIVSCVRAPPTVCPSTLQCSWLPCRDVQTRTSRTPSTLSKIVEEICR